MKLNVKAFGLSIGIVWAGGVILIGLLAMAMPDYCADFVRGLGTKYLGYSASFTGSLIGGVWGFFDAGIGGVIFAWLYNKFAK